MFEPWQLAGWRMGGTEWSEVARRAGVSENEARLTVLLRICQSYGNLAVDEDDEYPYTVIDAYRLTPAEAQIFLRQVARLRARRPLAPEAGSCGASTA